MKNIRGLGVGLRPAHLDEILAGPKKISWFEVLADNFMHPDGRHLRLLEKIRRDYPIVLHCVGLNLGSIDPLNEGYLKKLTQLVKRFEPSGISDHLAWIGCENTFHHDLLPLPFTPETLQHVKGRVTYIQEKLSAPFMIENVSSYLDFSCSTMTEWEFLNDLSMTTGCKLLLDVNNVYVNAVNHGFSAHTYLAGIADTAVAQFHVAGHSSYQSGLIDTHDKPVADPVRQLLKEALERFGSQPICLEWDQNLPSFQTLVNEANSLDVGTIVPQTIITTECVGDYASR